MRFENTRRFVWTASSARLLGRTTLPVAALVALAGVPGGPAHARGPINDNCLSASQTTIVYEAGRPDAYAAPFDSVTYGPELAAFLANGPGTKLFDQPGDYKDFGYTFKNLPQGITSAVLEVRCRADQIVSSPDDFFGLQRIGGTLGFQYLRQFPGLPGSPGQWVGGTDFTFTLDLSNLPGYYGSTNLLPSLNTLRRLDLWISDNTTVDYARLRITVCPCSSPYRIYTVGSADNFAGGTEPTYRQPALSALRTTPPWLWKDCDDQTTDRGWGHTFTGFPGGITTADLLVRMLPSNAGSGNDSVSLDLLGAGGPPAFGRGFNINTLAGAGSWTNQAPTDFLFNLNTTLPTGYAGTNLLGGLADGMFDVYLQDDTAVDYARLRVRACPNPVMNDGVIAESIFGAELATGPNGSLVVSNLSPGGGVRLDAHATSAQKLNFDPGQFGAFHTGDSFTASLLRKADAGAEPVASEALSFEIRESPTSPDSRNYFRHTLSRGGASEGCQPVTLSDSATGEQITTCLPTGGGVETSGTDLASVEIVAATSSGGSRHIVRYLSRQSLRCDDGTELAGDTIEFLGATSQDAGTQGAKIAVAWGGNGHQGLAAPNITISGIEMAVTSPCQIGDCDDMLPLYFRRSGGECTLNTNPGSLTIGNIGSSGQDGVSVNLGRAASFAMNLESFCGGQSTACASRDQSLTLTAVGEANGLSGQVLGESRVTSRIGHFFDIFTDSRSPGSGPMQVQVLNQFGEPISSVIVPGGTADITAEGGSGMAGGKVSFNEFQNLYTGFMFRGEMLFTIGGVAVTGWGVAVADLGSSATAVSTVTVHASGMDELDISNIQKQAAATAPPCSADFNRDGGIDGADVDAFFASWDAGAAAADVNGDGGVDGSDVEVFFAQWSNGGC